MQKLAAERASGISTYFIVSVICSIAYSRESSNPITKRSVSKSEENRQSGPYCVQTASLLQDVFLLSCNSILFFYVCIAVFRYHTRLLIRTRTSPD